MFGLMTVHFQMIPIFRCQQCKEGTRTFKNICPQPIYKSTFAISKFFSESEIGFRASSHFLTLYHMPFKNYFKVVLNRGKTLLGARPQLIAEVQKQQPSLSSECKHWHLVDYILNEYHRTAQIFESVVATWK